MSLQAVVVVVLVCICGVPVKGIRDHFIVKLKQSNSI